TRGQCELHDGVGEVSQGSSRNADRSTELTDARNLLEGDRGALRDLLEPDQQTGCCGVRLTHHSGNLRERRLLRDGRIRQGRRNLRDNLEQGLEALLKFTDRVADRERRGGQGHHATGRVPVGRVRPVPGCGQLLLLLGDPGRRLGQTFALDGEL